MNENEYIKNKFYDYDINLTFDDVLIVPNKSNVVPSEVDTSTRLTKKIKLSIPIISAAMDTVTDSRMAIAIAQLGGIGIIHRNFTINQQVEEVKKVKRYENIIINNPVVIKEDSTLKEVKNIMENYKISGIPVVDEENKIKGIVTRRDLDFFDNESNKNVLVKDIMTPFEDLITYKGDVDLKKASEIMRENRIEKLPIVDSDNKIIGLITLKDITRISEYPNATKDHKGRLRVGAAVGTSESDYERVKRLVEAEADVIVVDTAHGHQKKVIEMVKWIRSNFPDVNIIGGNIATTEAVTDLYKAGVDAVKVGIGPGSICTTRVIAGVGVPQISAIMKVYSEAQKYSLPIISDGGIKFSGDIAKAIAAGADVVMIGNLFAGTTESPGEFVIYKGRRYKTYRGMGSIGAMSEGSKSRYFQDNYEVDKLVPEGIEGMVPYKGDLEDVIYQLIGGLKSAMGYCGASTITEFKMKTKFIRISNASLRESHPHDIIITKEAPNYMSDEVDN